MRALLRQQFQAEWLSLLLWALGIGLLLFVAVAGRAVIGDQTLLVELEAIVHSMPDAVRALYGSGSLVSLEGWLEAVVFGGWVPILYVAYTGVFVAGAITREVERKTMEFLLSMPVMRWQVLGARWLGLVGGLVLLHGAHLMAVVVGVGVLGEPITVAIYALALLNSLLLHVALGSVMLLATLVVNDYGRALGLSLGIGFGLFFWHLSTAGASGALKALRDALPFGLYDPRAILIEGRAPLGAMAILGAITLVALGAAALVFERKQLAA